MAENNEYNDIWVQWVKGVYEELSSIRKDQNDQFNQLKDAVASNKDTFNTRITQFEKEFIEFKTKINARSALIASVFSVIVSGAALIYTILQISRSIPK